MYSINDYNYDLPDSLIAQSPAEKREHSRLLHLQRHNKKLIHRQFKDMAAVLDSGDMLVVNDTKVIPGRLLGRKDTGGKVEALILNYAHGSIDGSASGPYNGDARIFRCLLKSSKRPRAGAIIHFDPDLHAEVLNWNNGTATLKFICRTTFETVLERIGKVPLPPYIKRETNLSGQRNEDRTAYQTVYATHPGAIAAPTAGLHFSPEMLSTLMNKGIEIVRITLHVGYGTFSPVRVEDIRSHNMHAEWYHISPLAAARLNQARQDGRRIIAVGTTSVRTLEYHCNADGGLSPGDGSCDLFIYPGYNFKIVNGLITNFHLPRSTLLMLVAALAGRETILAAYQAAVKAKYRFFSYGDAMLIL